MSETNLTSIPTKTERNLVADTLKTVGEQDFDEVVILGFKNGKSYLHHSKIDDMSKLIGAIEWLKFRIMG
jgi:hypothetical protein